MDFNILYCLDRSDLTIIPRLPVEPINIRVTEKYAYHAVINQEDFGQTPKFLIKFLILFPTFISVQVHQTFLFCVLSNNMLNVSTDSFL